MTMSDGMQLSTARLLIECSLERMTARYEGVVFDEWALVRVGGDGATLAAYQGPRADQFRTSFLADAHALRALLAGRAMAVGEFAFAPAAEGTAFDACVRLGEGSYLLLNHTSRTMDAIRAGTNWRAAQAPFVELTEAFRLDPLA